MIVQGCGYCYVGLSYLPEDPDPSSIQMARADQPNIVCKMKDGLLSIEAEQYVGRQLAIYTLDGKCLRVATICRGVNQVDNLPRQAAFLANRPMCSRKNPALIRLQRLLNARLLTYKA